MGGWLSSSKPVEEELRYTISSLNHLRECIEGLDNMSKVQQAQFDLFLKNADSQGHESELKALGHGMENENCGEMHEEKNKRTLVKANQSSLQYHVRVVQTSFNTLEKTIQDSIRQFTSGNRTERELHAAKRYTKEFNQLQLDVFELEEQLQKKSEEIAIKTKENEVFQQKNKELMEEIMTLQRRNAEQETKESSLKKEMEYLKQLLQNRENTRQIQLFYQSRGDTMSKVVDGLKSLLVDKLEMDRNKIQFIDCQSEQDVNPEIPMFILCINTSRLGTDVGSAVQKLKGSVSAKVSILIFHHKDVHALPNQSSERVLTGPDFEKLGGIFDVAFLSEKGIYPCDMNDNTANKIVKFLRPKD